MLEISSEAAAHLKAHLDDVLPVLRNPAVDDESLKELLIGLYKAGLHDGQAKVESLLRQITEDMAQIVVAFIDKDAERLATAVGEFVERRVIVRKIEPSEMRH